LISAPELKHLTTSHHPCCDATNNGDFLYLSFKLISAPDYLRDEVGHSPLSVASQQGICDVVKCLL
jgi:hypothetical protein